MSEQGEPLLGFIGTENADGGTMVCIVRHTAEPGIGELVDALYCFGKPEIDAFLNDRLGIDRPISPIWERPMLS